MRGWDDALEAQNDLRASFHSAVGARYMDSFARSLTKSGKQYDLQTRELAVKGDPETATESVKAAIATVEAGDPMWVNADVVELVEFAAETFRAEALMPHHLFTNDAVFAYLEQPLVTKDLHGREAAFRAISWALCQYGDNPGARGVAIALWSHCDDLDDYHDEFTGHLIGGSSLSLMHTGSIPFGREDIMEDTGQRSLAVQLQVLWRLAKQEIVVAGRERVSRPVWRRKSNWREIKEVQVLTLRRAKHRQYEGPEREVEWTHRWFVHGHWRNQWYPSLQQHCQIFIDGYIKGPDDKPFMPKKHAIEFVR